MMTISSPESKLGILEGPESREETAIALAIASASSCAMISWHFLPTASFTGGILGESSRDLDQSRLTSWLGEKVNEGDRHKDCGLSKLSTIAWRSSDSEKLSASSSDMAEGKLPMAESRLLEVEDGGSILVCDS